MGALLNSVSPVRREKMVEIVVKANDGRGLGHILRVANFIGDNGLRDDTFLIVNEEYMRYVPKGMQYLPVVDYGYRVDLDQPWGSMPGSIVKKFDSKSAAGNINRAAANYYACLRNALHSDTDLFYLDDQNGMEALFLEDVGHVVGRAYRPIKEMMPNGRIAVEIETQYVHESPTRMRALKKADYIHLSSDPDFLKLGAPDFQLGGLEEKVIPMGFPLSQEVKGWIDSSRQKRKQLKKDLMKKYGFQEDTTFVYCTFGAGNGADEVMAELYGLAKQRKDTLFVVADPSGNLAKMFNDKGIACRQTANGAEVADLENLHLVKNGNRVEHFEQIAAADALIQANGSGGTYESMYAQAPSVNLPLKRAGLEQFIKARGIEKLGGGKMLLLSDFVGDNEVLRKLNTNGLGAYRLNQTNLGNALDDVFANNEAYRSRLAEWRSRFLPEKAIADTVRCMADINCVSPADIRKRFKLNRLKLK
jgi:hypothetical protein